MTCGARLPTDIGNESSVVIAVAVWTTVPGGLPESGLAAFSDGGCILANAAWIGDTYKAIYLAVMVSKVFGVDVRRSLECL